MSQAELHTEVRTTHPVSEAPILEPTITGPATPVVLPPEVKDAKVMAHHDEHALHEATQALGGHIAPAAEATPVSLNPSLSSELFGPSYKSLGHIGGGPFATVGVVSEDKTRELVEQRNERRRAPSKAAGFLHGVTSLFAPKPKGGQSHAA